MRWCDTACTLSAPVTPATRHWASSDGGAASAASAAAHAGAANATRVFAEVTATRSWPPAPSGTASEATTGARASSVAQSVPSARQTESAVVLPPAAPHTSSVLLTPTRPAPKPRSGAPPPAANDDVPSALRSTITTCPVAVVSASVLSELPPTSAPSLICVHCESSPSPSHDGAMPSNGSGMHDVPTWSAPSSSSQHGSDGSSNGSENVDWMLRCSHHVAGASVRKSRSYVSSSRSAQSADCSTKAEGDSHQAGADCAVPAKIAASKRARLIVSVNTAERARSGKKPARPIPLVYPPPPVFHYTKPVFHFSSVFLYRPGNRNTGPV